MPRLLSSPRFGGGNADLKQKCPAVPLMCVDESCLGDSTSGCHGEVYDGCPCTWKESCPVTSYNCADPDCGGAFGPEGPTCQKSSTFGCVCTVDAPVPDRINDCPAKISCNDPSCDASAPDGWSPWRSCGAKPLIGCSCQSP